MNLKKLALMNLIVMGLMGATKTMAGDLPYLGTLNKVKCRDKKINLPDENLTNEQIVYYTDVDCEIIFVAPPKLSVRVPRANINITMNSKVCPSLLAEKAVADSLSASVAIANEKIRSGKLSSDEKRQVLQNMMRDKELLTDIKELNEELYGDEPTVFVNGEIEIEWTKVINSMQAANPEYNVQRLPIYGGVIDMLRKVTTDSEVSYERGLKNVLTQKIHGQTVKDQGLQDLKRVTFDMDYENHPVSFGRSANFSMILNPLAGCSLDKNGDQILDKNASVGGRTAMTFTYFHPIETTASITVNPKVEAIVSILEHYTQTGGGYVNANQLLAAIKAKQAITITIEHDAFGNLDDGNESFIKDQVKEMAVESILNQVGALAEMSISTNQTTYQERHTSSGCSGGFLGFGRSCSSHTWYVTKHKTDWRRAIEALSVSLKENDLSAGTQVRRVYLISDTVGSSFKVGAQ